MPKLIWQDALAALGIGFNLVARFFSVEIVARLSAYTALAVNIEANPAQRAVISTQYLQFGIQAIVLALVLAMYVYFRRHRADSPKREFILDFVAILVFLVFFLDMLNDGAVLVGLILNH